MKKTISAFRKKNNGLGLELGDLNPDPFIQFEIWLKQAVEKEIAEPNAMSLATTSSTDVPSIRTVLSKTYDTRVLFSLQISI